MTQAVLNLWEEGLSLLRVTGVYGHPPYLARPHSYLEIPMTWETFSIYNPTVSLWSTVEIFNLPMDGESTVSHLLFLHP